MRCHAIYSLKSQWALKTAFSFTILLSFVTSASSVLFPWLLPRLRCALAVRRMNFDLEAFDRYGEFFSEDSVLEFSATGLYKGTEAIKEYVQFAFQNSSPYFVDTDINTPKAAAPLLTFLGIDGTSGLCEILAVIENTYNMEPGTANNALPPIRVIGMFKIYGDIRKSVITRFNLYYSADFIKVLFGLGLKSVNTQKYICQQMIEGSCKGIISTTTNSTVDCESKLAALPATDGPLSKIDGNTQGCRALHGVLAEYNPKMHCAHLSFEPLKDPLNRIKCQTTGTVLSSDLFTGNDFKIYNQYAIKNGIDPSIGHNCTTSACKN